MDPEGQLDNVAGVAAGLLFVLPLKPARERYDRQRALQRAVESFRASVTTYERRSGLQLPPVDAAGERDLDQYLSHVADWLADSNGGTWVHPMLETPTGQLPRTTDSAVEVWIIRSLDSAGVARNDDAGKALFLSLAVRLVELIADHCPPGVDITTNRKKIQNHSEFTGLGARAWRSSPVH